MCVYWICRGSTEASMAHYYMRECRLCNFKINCCGSNSVFSLCLLVCLMLFSVYFMSKISQPFLFVCACLFVIVLNAYMRQYVKYCLRWRANVGTANRTKWRKKRSQSLCVSLCWPLFPRHGGLATIGYCVILLYRYTVCWNTTICWARVQTQTAFYCVGSVSAKINLHASGKATSRRYIPRARVAGTRVSTQVALKLYDRTHSGISPMHKHFWTAFLAVRSLEKFGFGRIKYGLAFLCCRIPSVSGNCL